MKKFFLTLAKPIVLLFKTLDGAREFVEDRIADALDRIQESEPIDKAEKKLITTGIKAGLNYFCGACPLDDEKLNVISEAIVEKGINKVNPAISKQLRK
ncbi:MAG: hypothetical protein J6V44_09225 [Methanobrevibacter sp.]|nr:hypothetical protein [Methanobrevibacter sp.]